MSSVPSVAAIMGEDVARIYEAKGKLSAAASNPITMSGELPTYQIILSSVQGNEQVKQLAADYIPQFLHYFPTLVETGINAQLDLCEDDKVSIRLHAIRGLEMICKNNPSTVRRIAEMLGQLLVSEEKLELACVHTTFTSLFSIDPQAAFLALFTLVSTAVDATLKSAGLQFLVAQLKTMQGTLRKDEAVSAGLAAGLKALLLAPSNVRAFDRDTLRFLVQSLISFAPAGNNAAKIKADEPFKAELAQIALVQAGLGPAGAQGLDLANDAALKHFLSVLQSVVGNLASQYGVDTTPFSTVLFGQVLPNIESVADADTRTALLRAVANAAPRLTPKQAQQYFPAFYAQFKRYVPAGEIVAKAAPAAAASAAPAAGATVPAAAAAASPVAMDVADAPAVSAELPVAPLNVAFAEVFLYLFHVLAAVAPGPLRAATGIFTPTGQPGDFTDAAGQAAKAEFVNRIAFTIQEVGKYKDQLHATQKKIQEQTNAFHKAAKASHKKGAAGAGAAAAASPAAAGQPPAAATAKVADDVMSPEPAAASSPVAADDSAALIASLRARQSSVNFAIRQCASLLTLAKPLQAQPLPTLLPADKMSLSWREKKAPGPGDKQGQQQKGGAKGSQQQQQQGQKGGQKQQQQGGGQKQGQQQQQAKQGQKRKSGGGDQQQQGASHKKGGGNQQQQQQGGQNKKQRQGQSNKKGGNANGNQQQGGGGGGRRRR